MLRKIKLPSGHASGGQFFGGKQCIQITLADIEYTAKCVL